MENKHTFETVVGLFVLVVAVLFFRYACTKSGLHGIDGCTLSAKFDKADGLSEGGDVKISGIRVGKIISTEVDPNSFFAVVKFYVSKNLKLPKDTSANVASDGLFGGKYLSLTPGGEEKSLKEGDEIQNTTGPINIESLIGKFVFSQSSQNKGNLQ